MSSGTYSHCNAVTDHQWMITTSKFLISAVNERESIVPVGPAESIRCDQCEVATSLLKTTRLFTDTRIDVKPVGRESKKYTLWRTPVGRLAQSRSSNTDATHHSLL